MRKTRLLLAVPVVVILAALFGTKWKQDHPTPTKEDLAIRQEMAHPLTGKLVYFSKTHAPVSAPKGDIVFDVALTQAQMAHLSERFFFLDRANPYQTTSPTKKAFHWARPGDLCISWLRAWSGEKMLSQQSVISLHVPTGQGTYYWQDMISRNSQSMKLHPVTVKHLLNTLFDDPKIGPKLRKVMKR